MPTPSPREPRVVHELSAAPAFVGRDRELAELQRLWKDGFHGVLALVGLGGAGKTALAAPFVQALIGDEVAVPRPDRALVWSFYRDADTSQFLREALRYFSDNSNASPARGLGVVHQLYESLCAGGPHLIVLDGLERVQVADVVGDQFGRLQDPLLKSLLRRIASGSARVMVVITSRFPITDLADSGDGLEVLEMGGLDDAAAVSLLRRRGVRGDDEVIRQLVASYDGHALSLDHLGGMIGELLDGDLSRASELPEEASTDDPASRRLGRLLRSYERHLPPAEVEVLSKLSLFRACISEDQAIRLLVCTPAIRPQDARDLRWAITKSLEADGYPDEVISDWGRSIAETIESQVSGIETAGPQVAFRRDLLKGLADWGRQRDVTTSAGEVARLYAQHAFDTPDDRRPLEGADRRQLVHLADRVHQLREDPLFPYQEPSPQMLSALCATGYHAQQRSSDLNPVDLLQSLAHVEWHLRHLLAKHFLLVHIRQVIRRYQEKWELAGPLARLSAVEIRKIIERLVSRHLLLREANGELNAHPAVRDFFRQRVANQNAWHSLIRDQLVTLVGTPGSRYAEDKDSLDTAEEAIFHTLAAGDIESAQQLYEQVLGGHTHLAWRLGEVARGMRILKLFPACPDRWSLAWYQRLLGELDDAFVAHSMSNFRAEIRLLQGRLPEVAALDDDHSTAVAAFLMGQTIQIPSTINRCAIALGQLHLYRGEFAAALRVARIEDLYERYGWGGDRARCLLVLAQLALREGRLARCREYVDDASKWILHSGSVEHLCYLHLVRARIARQTTPAEAARAIEDGSHLAEQCGLRLFQVELLCERASLHLSTSNVANAEVAARDALNLAESNECQFAWGVASAGQCLADALVAQDRIGEAKPILAATFATRQRINHPETEITRLLMQRFR